MDSIRYETQYGMRLKKTYGEANGKPGRYTTGITADTTITVVRAVRTAIVAHVI